MENDGEIILRIQKKVKEAVKQELVGSIMKEARLKNDDLNEKDNTVEKEEDAESIIRTFEDIINTKQKTMICITYRQGLAFKRLQEKKTNLVT